MLALVKSVSWPSEAGFSDQAWEDCQYWLSTNDKVHERINELIKRLADADPLLQCLRQVARCVKHSQDRHGLGANLVDDQIWQS